MIMGSSRKLGSTFPSCVWYFFCAGFLVEKQAYFLFYEHPIGEELPYVRHFSKYVGERVWNCRQVLAAKSTLLPPKKSGRKS